MCILFNLFVLERDFHHVSVWRGTGIDECGVGGGISVVSRKVKKEEQLARCFDWRRFCPWGACGRYRKFSQSLLVVQVLLISASLGMVESYL